MHVKFDDSILQPFRRYGWCPTKFKWFTWPDHAAVRDRLPSMD